MKHLITTQARRSSVHAAVSGLLSKPLQNGWQGSDLYDRDVHDRLCKASFDFCENEASKYAVPMPNGQAPPPPPAGNEAAPPPPQPQVGEPQVGEAPAPPPPQPPSPPVPKPKLPINISGVWKAALGPAKHVGRKSFTFAVGWQPPFKLGATVAFTDISHGISPISFTISADKAAENKSIKLGFSVPASFQSEEVTLSGLKVVKFAPPKKKKVSAGAGSSNDPLPTAPPKRANGSASSDNASRKKKAAPQAAANPQPPDELVLVPHSLWNDYACDEFAGKGWLARIITRKRGWARVEFLHARDKEGKKYQNADVPLSLLLPVPADDSA